MQTLIEKQPKTCDLKYCWRSCSRGRPVRGYILAARYTEYVFSWALKTKTKKTLIKTNAQKGRVLPLCHPLLAITGWMRRRRRCRDAERRPGTETWNDHRIDSQYTDGCKLNTETTLTCLNRDPAFVPDVGRHVDRSPPSISPKRRLTESGPSPRLQTPDGQQEGGLRWQRKAPPPLHRLSQSHCRVIYKQESLHDASEGLGS